MTGRRWGIVAAVAALALAPARAGAGGTALACGATLSASVTLAADLSCPGSSGLTVGRDGIAINLNGHSLGGDGTGGTDGIAVGSHTGVTVENGTIDDFAADVSVNGGSVRVTAVRITGATQAGLFAVNSDVTATGDLVYSNAVGILAAAGGTVRVTDDTVESNSQQGISLVDLDAATVSSDKALNNGTDGIVLNGTGTVSANVANGNGTNGIEVASIAAGVKAPATVTRNRASFNAQLGILVSPGGANDGGGNTVQSNGTAVECENVVCTEVNG